MDLLEESDIGRVASLIPVKYGRMSVSLFTFFRGSAIVQARDLANTPTSGITVQLCGDAHMMNFGGFATPERSLAFDVNDFDETFPGPWEWDVKRLAVSVLLGARDRGFTEEIAEKTVLCGLASYRERMAEFARYSVLERWYQGIRVEDLLESFKGRARTERTLQKAQAKAAARTSESVFPKLTAMVNGRAKIVDDPPRIFHVDEAVPDFEKTVRDIIDRYKAVLSEDRLQLLNQFQLADSALKVVGVGSVGTRCFIALGLANQNEPLFLQIKEARRSVLESPVGSSRFEHQGQRVVVGQRLMQAASDIFLGWTDVPGQHDYYVRQLRDMKVSADFETFRPSGLANYATMCGWALARAHAKAGDPDAIAGYLGTGDAFDRALLQYTKAYAQQVVVDYAAFQDAIGSGRLPIQTER